MSKKLKGEGEFGFSHIFMTAAISLTVAVATGYFLDPSILAYSHMTEAGMAQTQLTQQILGPFNQAVSDTMMTFLEPMQNHFNVATQYASVTADGMGVLPADAQSIPLGDSSMQSLNPSGAVLGG